MPKYHFTVLLLLFIVSHQAMSDESAIPEEIQAYLDFATYGDGIITLEQLSEIGENVIFIDSRSFEQFEQGHIPKAINIEWRETVNRVNEIAKDIPVVLYCNTGALSAKAQFILRLAGYENALVLHGGYDAWNSAQEKTKE